jgi:hypothetical protein
MKKIIADYKKLRPIVGGITAFILAIAPKI